MWKTPVSSSAIVVFPRKFPRFKHFLDSPIRLLLAPEASFGEVTGTIPGDSVGTASAAAVSSGSWVLRNLQAIVAAVICPDAPLN
jgi:hypothetical protein